MRHCFLFGPYFLPFFNGQFLKCDILPVSNDPVLCALSDIYTYMTFGLFTQMSTSISPTDRYRFWDQPVLSIFHPEGHVSQQNGIAGCMNWTIQERVVSMLQHSGVSYGFWVEALLTEVHIINMSPSRPLGLNKYAASRVRTS